MYSNADITCKIEVIFLMTVILWFVFWSIKCFSLRALTHSWVRKRHFLRCVGPISISTVKPTRCTNVSNLFYFGMTLYMFRTVFPSIIVSSSLYIQQQASVKQILLSACVHYREFKTVHTATAICQTDTTVCLCPSSGVQDCTYSNSHLSNRYCCLLASKQTAVSVVSGTSSWFYYRNNITMHGPMNVKFELRFV